MMCRSTLNISAPAPRRLLWSLLLLWLLTGCGGSETDPDPIPDERGALVSVESSSTAGAMDVLAALLALQALDVDTSGLSGIYGVSLSTIIYKTRAPDGRLINASGILAYPLKSVNAPSPLLSFQHGTIFLDTDAPSRSDSDAALLMAIAGSGYIIAMPDYIGYGASNNEIHTYVHAQGLAAAVVDMLRATRTLLARENIATNGQLFLAGYSEGGYATLSAQKEMELNLSAEFSITASMPGAGPYDMSASSQYMAGLNNNEYPQYLGYVFKAYDHWYEWNRLDTIYLSSYHTIIDTYYDGTHSSSTINGLLPYASADLFNPLFRDAFLASGETAIKADFAANDIYDWAPQTPTQLFHGRNDSIVPYLNTQNAVTAMSNAGSTQVSLVDCNVPAPFADHAECVPDYLNEVIAWFGSLAQDL